MLRKLKLNLTLSVLLFTFTVGGFTASAQTSDAGSVRFALRTGSDFDIFTNTLSSIVGKFLNQKVWRMQVSSPYFDSRLNWYGNAWVYEDLYGIPTNSPIVWQHPDWILKDTNGNMLYVPFACNGQTCSQYAGDPGNPDFRNAWIQAARNTLGSGYKGLWIDDVNMIPRVGDGTGNQIAPYDPRNGNTMSEATWRDYIAGFARQIRSAFPGKEILHNVIWFSDNDALNDPSINSAIQAADYIICERGIDDAGLTGGDGPWSLNAFLRYVDLVHSLGRSVVFEEYKFNGDYPLAGYFLISNGNDAFGNQSVTPDNWWEGYDVHLGTPQGNRYVWNGLLRRDFSGGMVLLNPPQSKSVTVDLPGSFQRIGGQTVSSISLGASQGAVLIGGGSDPNPPPSEVAVNSGGSGTGNFLADAYQWGGHADSVSRQIDLNGVQNAAPQEVYQTKRTSNGGPEGFGYTIPNLNPGQTYTVRLHFADDFNTQPGARLFNVWINGNWVLYNFDIFAAAGNRTARAVVKDFTTTADGGGSISIQYGPGPTGNALSSGIEIIP